MKVRVTSRTRASTRSLPSRIHRRQLLASLPHYRGLKSTRGIPSSASIRRQDLSLRAKVAQTVGVSVIKKTAVCTTAGLNLVFVSAEVTPWSKTGGLGDVVGGLPIELSKLGHKVMTIAPRYDQYYDGWDTSITAEVCGETVRFFHAKKQGVDRVFIDHPCFLSKVWGKTGSKLYGEKSGSDFKDNQKRFRLFCEAAIEAARKLPFGPGENCTFVANDWHSGLVPVLLKDIYQPKGEFKDSKCIFCVHNIAFQGRFWPEDFEVLSLPEKSKERFEFVDGYPLVFDEDNPADDDDRPEEEAVRSYKKINWMKAAFTAADKVVTVSPNYAKEILSGEDRGVELDDVLQEVGVEGIVNGMDTTDWDPSRDKFLDVKYDKETVDEGKALAKEALQGEAGLPVEPDVPVFGFIGRLEEQKGVDILLDAIPKVMQKGKVQVVILGTGKKKFEASLKKLDSKYPDTAKGIAKFSPRLAHLITAGADFMLVPSRFEPCGLIQLQAMQYGTVPLVTCTGGLVDTVKDKVTGFHIGEMDQEKLLEEDSDAIAKTMLKASEVYTTSEFKEMVHACINQDLSWKKPAKKWEAVIEEMIDAEPALATAKKQSVKTPVMDV